MKLMALRLKGSGKLTTLIEDCLSPTYYVYKEISCSPRLVISKGIPIRKGSHKICLKRFLKRKDFQSNKERSALYYYKNSNILTNQGTHNLPLSSTLELWEVLTWPSEGIWPAPHWCLMLGLLFLCCASVTSSMWGPCSLLLIFRHH